jgi:hypothetical protein
LQELTHYQLRVHPIPMLVDGAFLLRPPPAVQPRPVKH